MQKDVPQMPKVKKCIFWFRELVDLLGLQLSNHRGLFVKLPRAAMADQLVDKAAAPFPMWEGCPGKPTDEHYKPGRLIVSEPSLQICTFRYLTPHVSPWSGLCQQCVRSERLPNSAWCCLHRMRSQAKAKCFGRCSRRSSDLARQLPSVRAGALARLCPVRNDRHLQRLQA